MDAIAEHQAGSSRTVIRLPTYQRMAMWFWGTAVALVPLYLAQSGSVQVADVTFLAATGTLLLGGLRLTSSGRSAVGRLLAFVAYVFVVNLAWSLVLSGTFPVSRLPLNAALFYVFNGLLVVGGIALASSQPARLIRVTRLALAAALAVNVGAVLVEGVAPGRMTLFFNNPNQLGYFAVLASSIYLLTSTRNTAIADALAMAAALLLAAASLSKGAMVAVIAVVAIAILRGRLVMTIFVLAALAITTITPAMDGLFDRAQLRLESIGQDSDDSLEGRGYDKLWRFPELLMFGAGEGAYARFDSRIELHSSPGTLLFSYGVVGTSLFLWFLYGMWRRNLGWIVLASAPIWLYGLTHQGLRARLFWVFIVLGFAVANRLGARRAHHHRTQK